MTVGPSLVEVVCFDLGGVLVRLRPDWHACCAAAGFEPPEGIERLIPSLEPLVARHQRGELDGRAFAEAVSRSVDGRLTPAQVLAAHAAWLDGEHPGVGEVVDRLHAAGVRTACLSNTNDEHWRRLDELPTLRRLGARLASHRLGMRKPEPDIYAAAERALGARASAILFFDDAIENVEAALARGWRAERIDPAEGPTAPQILGHLARHAVLEA